MSADAKVVDRRFGECFGCETLYDINDALLAALQVLRAEHSRVEPHHEDMCAICKQADAALAKAQP